MEFFIPSMSKNHVGLGTGLHSWGSISEVLMAQRSMHLNRCFI